MRTKRRFDPTDAGMTIKAGVPQRRVPASVTGSFGMMRQVPLGGGTRQVSRTGMAAHRNVFAMRELEGMGRLSLRCRRPAFGGPRRAFLAEATRRLDRADGNSGRAC